MRYTSRKDTGKVKPAASLESNDIIESIRDLPRITPGLAFRIKVVLYSSFMSPDVSTEKNRSIPGTKKAESGALRRDPRSFSRYAVAVGVALLVAIASFVGLSGLSRNANPGDSLYFMKRAGEGLDLTFTWNQASRARKNIEFAHRRLSELEELVSHDEINPEKIAYLTNEFEQNKQAANNLVDPDDRSEKNLDICSDLDDLEGEKRNVARQIVEVAGAEGLQEPASGAEIAIYAKPEDYLLEEKSSIAVGKTDSGGTFRFTLKVSDQADLEQLTAMVELDGRRAALPLCEYSGQEPADDESFSAVVEPGNCVLARGSVKQFQLTMFTDNGDPASETRLRLKDSSGNGLIDGERGWVTLETDSRGSCDFSFTKVSSVNPSRISLEVYDNGWKDLGDVLVIGEIEFESPDDETEARSLDEGFTIVCEPELESLKAGNHQIAVTVRKEYEKLTDYFD